MIKILTAGLCILLLLVIPVAVQAQVAERCSFVRNELLRQRRNPRKETTAQFEAWIQNRLAGQSGSLPSIAATFTVPVVVHVIHNGITDVTNISDAQVLSQISVLNEDFKRLNADAVNTPMEFQPVAGSIDIQFVLAARDPEGLPSNGIVRIQGTKTGWSLDEQSEMKALSYWPAEEYLNIWVVRFSTNDIGYAQFPVSPLAGLENASEDRLTDGVVVDFSAFGSADDGAFPLQARFNKGRTATHEIGHFFGLRHIWGDVSNCGDPLNPGSSGDFVADTPAQLDPTTFCPVHPQVSCSHNKMFMNYMDYTDDGCMNLFTVDQAARMIAVLTSSPRRLSLLTSPGSIPPTPVANDLGIRTVTAPTTVSCLSSVSPIIVVRNYGTNSITSAQVSLTVNGTPTQTKPLPASLAPLNMTNIVFDPIALPGSSVVEFAIETVNGGTDGEVANDDAMVTVSTPASIGLPVSEPFASLPSGWTVSNPDNQISWANVTAADNSPSNKAMKVDFYNYENEGVSDWLLTPSFQLVTPENAQLRFDLAYAQYSGEVGDGLRVYALRGCNPDLSQAILLYDKSDASLATTGSTINPFSPTNATQWRKSEVLTLSILDTSTPWQLAFVAHNGYGNNLYLDNVVVSEDEISDIAMDGVVSPGIVHCLPTPSFKFSVTNLGTFVVNNFTASITVNNGAPQTEIFSVPIPVGTSHEFSFLPVILNPGVNEVQIAISQPNGIPDIAGNNVITINSFFDQSADKGPLRMTFDNPQEISWRVASPSDAEDWEAVTTNKAQSISYKSFTNPSIGQESWLVSPNLDLRPGPFSLFFDVSYAQNVPADDRLQIRASTDCGANYDQILFDRAASTVSTGSSSMEWVPGTNDDWRKEYVDLTSLSGLKNVRLAFVARNDNGNNLYIDNIELFEGDNPNPPLTTVPYQLYYSTQYSQSDIALTFHLDVRQDVQLQIVGLQGNVVGEYQLPDTLNQTYYFDLGGQAAGLYLFRMTIDNRPAVTKVFIGH